MAKRKPFKLTSKIIPARTAIYCRVASVDQLEPTRGLDEQEKVVLESITYRNSLGLSAYQVEAVYRDQGSGVTLERPGLQALLLAVKEDKLDVVFVSDIARLTRSLRDFAEIWHTLRSHHCRIVGVHESFDTNQWMLTTVEKELRHA